MVVVYTLLFFPLESVSVIFSNYRLSKITAEIIQNYSFSVSVLGTVLAGALYREFREFMRILTTFVGKNPQKSIIISTNGRNTRIVMDFCGFFQGKSSEFA